MQDSKLRSRLKAQLTKFSSDLCRGLSRPLEKFVGQMLFGIQASQALKGACSATQDVKLSNIARSLKEEIPLIKTEDRLSRNLRAVELEAELTPQLAKMARQRITADTVLCLDLSDIRKEYAKKMEYLATVHDGSTGEIYQKMYSAEAKEFVSETRKCWPASIWSGRTHKAAGSGPWIEAVIERNCWNPCWTGGSALSFVPRGSASWWIGRI